jgi:single-stranded-DNA-specific exonuclease
MGENRILAFHGLRQINNSPSTGLKAVIDICGLGNKDVTMSDIIFKIGPRINASGRMQNGKESVALLVEHNYDKALKRAELINQYNEERKELDKRMTEEASKIVASMPDLAEKAAIVITHYQRLLDYIVPDVVHVLKDGRIVKTAGKELVAEIEEKGYDNL